MSDQDEKERTLNLFPGSHHQSFNRPDFRVAGRDIFTPTIAPTINVNVTTSAPATGLDYYGGSGGSGRGFLPTLPPPTSPATNLSLKNVRNPGRLSNMLVSLRQLINPRAKSAPARKTSQAKESRWSRRKVEPTNQQTLRHRSSWASSASAESGDSGFTVSSIDEPEDWTVDSPKSPKVTTPDVYVSRMLKSGKGLACWQPRPQRPYASEHGTVPGDVGTFTSEGGFKKLFNLWEDDVSVRRTAETYYGSHDSYQLPPWDVVLAESRLLKGDTVVQGATARALYGDNDKIIGSFEFQCRSQEGAVLAITSPADLEELADHTALREHIFQHAELLYRHSNAVRRLADDEPLYIITGCIKSETWALAAFDDPTASPNDILRLVNMPFSTAEDSFVWTDRGTAEARVGRSERTGTKDQTLFLRGFKLAFSSQFLRHMRNSQPLGSAQKAVRDAPLAPQADDPLKPNDKYLNSRGTKLCDSDESEAAATHAQLPAIPSGLDPPRIGEDTIESDNPWSLIRQGQSASTNRYGPSVVQVMPITPHSSPQPCHPCDIINRYILDNTDADFALSHDDDWSFLLKDPLWNDLICSDMTEAPRDMISVRKGVAFLTDAASGEIVNEERGEVCMRFEGIESPSLRGSDKEHCADSTVENSPPTEEEEAYVNASRKSPSPGPLELAPSAQQHYVADWIQRQGDPWVTRFNIPQASKQVAQEYASLSAAEEEAYERLSQTANQVREKEHEAYIYTPSPAEVEGENLSRVVNNSVQPLGEQKARKGKAHLTTSEPQPLDVKSLADRAQSTTGIFNPEEGLRLKLGLEAGQPLNLWSLPDPKRDERPPHSYPLLVQLAIYGSPMGGMTLNQIYKAIEERFEYYRNRPEGSWKAEIRQNLTLNQILISFQDLNLQEESKGGDLSRCYPPNSPQVDRPSTRQKRGQDYFHASDGDDSQDPNKSVFTNGPAASAPSSPHPANPSAPAPSLLLSKPFRCPKPNCNKAYKRANGLKYHMMHGSCNFAPPKDLEHIKDYLERKRREPDAQTLANGGQPLNRSLSTGSNVNANQQGQIGGLATTLDTALLNSYCDLNLQSMKITETELREVERETEKRLRPFACSVGDCQRRYKNMNGLRYHYQHSGQHGASGIALLASGQHECLQNNHSAKRREQQQQQQQHHHSNSSNTHSASSHNRNATNSNYSSNFSNSTPSAPAPTSDHYGATTFAMDEEREGRKRFGNPSAFPHMKGFASVPVSRAASSSHTGTPLPMTVPASANTSPKANAANMHIPSPPPVNSSLNALPTSSTSSLGGALGTSSMTTPIQAVPVHVQQVNGVGINTGLPPTSPPLSVATSPGQHHATAGSPGQQQVTQQQMQQMAAAAYQQYAQQFQTQYQAAMQMHAAQQQQAIHQVHQGQQGQAQPQQSQGDWTAGMGKDMS